MAARGVPPPKGLGGARQDLWADFSFKLTSYLRAQEPDYGELMDRAARDLDVITDERLARRNAAGEGVLEERCVRMPRHLKYLLVLLCNGAPLTLIRTANTDNGFEIWRRLPQRYAPNQVASHFGILGHILEPVLPEARFQGALAHWGGRDYQIRTGSWYSAA